METAVSMLFNIATKIREEVTGISEKERDEVDCRKVSC